MRALLVAVACVGCGKTKAKDAPAPIDAAAPRVEAKLHLSPGDTEDLRDGIDVALHDGVLVVERDGEKVRMPLPEYDRGPLVELPAFGHLFLVEQAPAHEVLVAEWAPIDPRISDDDAQTLIEETARGAGLPMAGWAKRVTHAKDGVIEVVAADGARRWVGRVGRFSRSVAVIDLPGKPVEPPPLEDAVVLDVEWQGDPPIAKLPGKLTAWLEPHAYDSAALTLVVRRGKQEAELEFELEDPVTGFEAVAFDALLVVERQSGGFAVRVVQPVPPRLGGSQQVALAKRAAEAAGWAMRPQPDREIEERSSSSLVPGIEDVLPCLDWVGHVGVYSGRVWIARE